MPVIFFSIFAAIFSNGIATGSDKKLRIGLVCAEQTPVGTELLEFFQSSSSLQCASLNDSLHSQNLDAAAVASLIQDAQNSGRYDLVIKLPYRVSTNAADNPSTVTLVTDGQNSMAVAMVTSLVNAFYSQKQARAFAEKFSKLQPGARDSEIPQPQHGSFFKVPGTPAEVLSESNPSQLMKTDEHGVVRAGETEAIVSSRWALPKSVNPEQAVTSAAAVNQNVGELTGGVDEVSILVENPQAMNQENPRIAMYAAGIAVLFLLFSATGSAAALLEEEESGTLDRILVSKAGLFHIISGKWLGIFLLGCVQISAMFLWAEMIFRIQLWKHLDGFAVMTVCTAAATSSFAMLMATLCTSRAQLNAASVVIILSMSAVGGSMIPRFVMSDRMKEIGKWTFNAWALDGYQKVFWYQSPVSSLQTEVAVLLGSAFVFGVLALVFSRRWKRG
jgi:ABC-2 type transport system permease protein